MNKTKYFAAPDPILPNSVQSQFTSYLQNALSGYISNQNNIPNKIALGISDTSAYGGSSVPPIRSFETVSFGEEDVPVTDTPTRRKKSKKTVKKPAKKSINRKSAAKKGKKKRPSKTKGKSRKSRKIFYKSNLLV